MRASIHGRTSTVRLMLDAKADASLQSIDGSTALMLAEYHNHTAIAQVLRQHAKRSTATAEARAAAVAAELLAEEAEDKDLSGGRVARAPPCFPRRRRRRRPHRRRHRLCRRPRRRRRRRRPRLRCCRARRVRRPTPVPSKIVAPPCTLNMCGHCEMPAVADAESWPIRCV